MSARVEQAPAVDTRPETIAAVDLGSNSFHMLVGRSTDDGFRIVDRMRDAVRLAAGLDERKALTDEAIARALDCLARFGERLRGLPPGAVRVVGTNTLRKARNANAFIARAEAALGHPVDVISGYEEARLIYLGVSHGLDDGAEQRLVIDIGGGSTEFILGRRFDPLHMESLHMGCVSHSQAFFADGKIDGARMKKAELAARQELEPLETPYRRRGWQSALGASGTILAIRDIVVAAGWSDEGITPRSLQKLKAALIEAGSVDKLSLTGLSDDRRPVFPGGVAILAAAFEALGIERMRVSDSALREGVLYDLLGRIQKEDVRERTISDLLRRYEIDAAHAERCAATALSLLDQVSEVWAVADEFRRILRWAASLHEIGLSVSHSQYQKHGGYLLTHLDMPGFSRGEQQRLATLVRGHRRKLPLSEFERLPTGYADITRKLCYLLRLACVLHRQRSDESLPPVRLELDEGVIRLGFPDGWLDERPLTRAGLESEASYLKAAGAKLKFR